MNIETQDNCVWAVTQGSYSDYRVIAVATTKELAEQIRDGLPEQSLWRDSYDVEQIQVAAKMPPVQMVLTLGATIYDDGRCVIEEPRERSDYLWTGNKDEWKNTLVEEPMEGAWRRYTQFASGSTKRNPGKGELQVSGTDYDLVRKEFDEKLQLLLDNPELRQANHQEFHLDSAI